MGIVHDVVQNIGMSARDAIRVIASAPARYYVFEIEKRSGGTRTIAQPARELKAIQSYILRNKLCAYPVHPAATAYEKGCSIKRNANYHVNSNIVIKLDFVNFFNSIMAHDWMKFYKKNQVEEIESSEINLYTKILFWSKEKNSKIPRCLSIGAPTSPTLSNILMYDLDCKISSICDEYGVAYTRYADDISLSSMDRDAALAAEKSIVSAIKRNKSPKLFLNAEKRGVYTKGMRRSITGLILTPNAKVSIGRERKRLISAMLHRLSVDDLPDEKIAELKGFLGFSVAVEVSFVESMRQKYGNEVVDRAMKFHVPRKS